MSGAALGRLTLLWGVTYAKTSRPLSSSHSSSGGVRFSVLAMPVRKSLVGLGEAQTYM